MSAVLSSSALPSGRYLGDSVYRDDSPALHLWTAYCSVLRDLLISRTWESEIRRATSRHSAGPPTSAVLSVLRRVEVDYDTDVASQTRRGRAYEESVVDDWDWQ